MNQETLDALTKRIFRSSSIPQRIKSPVTITRDETTTTVTDGDGKLLFHGSHATYDEIMHHYQQPS